MTAGENARKVTVIAHRGGSALFFENTLTAFRKAEELGVDAIECDVHLTRDGRPVVIHDSDLRRIAGIDRRVSDLTFEEVSEIKLEGGEHIPSLEEVFESVGIPLVVELKGSGTFAALSDIFDRHPEYVGKCAVICFFHAALLMLRQKYPDLITGALLAGFPVDPVSVTRSCKANTLSLNFQGVTKEYVGLCHDGGISVSVWTPNEESDIREMIDAGVDSIATDRPDIALRLLGRS